MGAQVSSHERRKQHNANIDKVSSAQKARRDIEMDSFLFSGPGALSRPGI